MVRLVLCPVQGIDNVGGRRTCCDDPLGVQRVRSCAVVALDPENCKKVRIVRYEALEANFQAPCS